jgi:hypothetical protein
MKLFPYRGTPSRSFPFRPLLESLEDRRCPSSLVAPTIKTLVADSATQATITWGDVANESGYRVLQWDGTKGVTVATVAADTTTNTITGLTGDRTVWFSVEAFDGTSTADSAWGTLDLPTEPLTAASGLKTTAVSQTEVDLSWTDAQGETGYHILQWDQATNKADVIANVAAGEHTAAVTGLTPGTAYYFSVEAYNDVTSAATDWALGTTTGAPINAPGKLTLTAGATKVALKWKAAPGATGYHIFESINNQPVQVGETGPGTTKFTVTGLQSGTIYWFSVQAINSSNAASTPWKHVTTKITKPLAPPGHLTVTAVSSTEAQLDWTLSSGAVGYTVYQWTGSKSKWQAAGTVAGTVNSVRLSGLTAGKRMYFAVIAFTADNVQTATSKVVVITL